MATPFSYVLRQGDGSTKVFSFAFPYLSKDHIHVKVGGVEVAYMWTGDYTLALTSAPTAGTYVEVRRITPKDAVPVDFTDGSVLAESDLDLQTLFNLYCVQEIQDGEDAAIRLNAVGQFDARGYRITNVGDPIDSQDAVTKKWALANQAVNPDATLRADLANTTDVTYGDALVAVKQPLAGAVVRTQHSKNFDVVSVKDFGAVGDGVADDTNAINAAYSVVSTVYFPAGTYRNSVTASRQFYGPGIPVTLAGTVASNFANTTGIEVDSVDALQALPTGTPAGIIVKTRKENLTFVVLAASSTNPVLDFSDVGGVKFTYLDGITRTFSYGTKDVAYNRAQADAMSADLSAMVGYAAQAGTTGGGSGTIYWVTNTTDDIFTTGSLRWAIDQVRTAGSGRVLFHPRGAFEVFLNSQIILPPNITIDAPGRNARIWAPTDVTRFKLITTSNVIIRRLQFSSTPGATATLRDGIWITPDSVDKVWIDQCSFRYAGDGCMDMSTLVEMTSGCRVTVSRNLIRQHDKGMLLGSLACYNPNPPAWCPTASPDAIKLFITLYANVYDSVGQRQPKVVSQTFVDSVNNVHRLCQQNRDDGTTGATYGILTATGGAAISRGDYFTSAQGLGWSGVDAVRTAQSPIGGGTGASDGPGVVSFTADTVAADGITLASYQPEKVPAISYTLVPTPIPATSFQRRKFANAIRANAGAEFDSAPEGTFRWVPTSAVTPNGYDVLSETADVGRWHRLDKNNEVPPFSALLAANQTFLTPRNKTQTLASDSFTVPDTGTFFAVDTEGAASSDDLVTINGGLDGRWIVLRSASSGRPVTVRSTGNIAVPSDYVLSGNTTAITLMYEGTVGKWLLIERPPLYTNTWNGANALRLGAYYLWVDSSGRLRIKSSAPTLDTDGTVVGTQA